MISQLKRFTEGEIIRILSQTPYATAIFRRNDLVIEAANAGMLVIWGKNRDVIGMPLIAALPELKEQPFIGLLKNVLQTGESYEATNTPATLRINGKDEIFFFDFGYHPIFDEEGNVFCILNVAVDVTERYKKALATAKNEETLKFSMAAANVGLWHIDLGTKFLTSSQRLKELFGFAADQELTLESALAKIPEDYRDAVRSKVDAVMANGGDYDVQHPIILTGDKKSWVRAIGRVSKEGADAQSHFSGIMIDITETKLQNIRKDNFISMVSHELKTPLTSLSGYAEIISSMVAENGDSYFIGALDKMSRQIKKMTKLINGFVTLSRLEAYNKIHLEKTRFNMDELLLEIVDEQKLISSNFLIQLHDCDEIEVFADRSKIGVVLENLIGNANKYSPLDKHIQVVCKTMEQRIRISVSDNGLGVSTKDIGNLFRRYSRVEETEGYSYSGFGLGLYLSAEIISAHDGTIWVESELGKGSTFYFELPLFI